MISLPRSPKPKNQRMQNKIHTLVHMPGKKPYYVAHKISPNSDLLAVERRKLKPGIEEELRLRGSLKGSAKSLFESNGSKKRKNSKTQGIF